ncbi:MAG TPA: S41 family peptidase [Longimicrobiales bacterium]|nr:S41 family peptidase [Longimicrobiales bacterium]
MRMRRSILAPVVVALVALVTGGWLLQRGVSQERNVYLQMQLLEDVLRHVSEKFVDEKEPATLYRMAIDGLLKELGDPHTSFMTPEDYEGLRVQTQGEYGGLGIHIDVRDGWVTVISPLPGTPAQRAGLQAGDKIIEVDGESTRGWTADDAVSRLRGPKGTAVEIKVSRAGVDEAIPFRIVREEIEIKSVPAAYLMDGGVGYVEIRHFSERTTDDLRQAIDRLRSEGMRGLILDLRHNPGGLLDQGVSVADLFLDRGKVVVETRGRMAMLNQKYTAVSPDMYPDLPIVVLVDRASASASEIVAGALQDHDRALVIGETTFGKGSVQSVFPLANGNYLKLTTARWYTPVGRSIQKPYGANGLPLAVADESEEADSASLGEPYRTDGGRIVYGGGGIRPDVPVPPDTLTTREVEFMRAVQRHGSKYRDAVYAYALRYGRERPNLRPGFEVTGAMLSELYTELVAAGVEVDRELYDSARRLVSRDLGIEITRSKWGEEEWRKRLNAEDTKVQLAARLLRQAKDVRSLFALASAYAAEQGASAAVEGGAAPAVTPPER